LSYIDQIAIAEYIQDYDDEPYEPMDAVAGY
jgi:hypothetical protein